MTRRFQWVRGTAFEREKDRKRERQTDGVVVWWWGRNVESLSLLRYKFVFLVGSFPEALSAQTLWGKCAGKRHTSHAECPFNSLLLL